MRVWFAVAVVGLSLAPSAARAQSLAEVIGGCGGAPPTTTKTANPSDYLTKLSTLAPGERLLLDPGTYSSGLPINSLNGSAGACIFIEGPATAPPAIFTGRDCCNTVSIRSSSYIVIRGLELDGQGRAGDAVKAEFDSAFAHHITLENLNIHGHDGDQQIVGINTKSLAWNWVIRSSVIDGAGTGIYLGNSDGEGEFVRGLIEHNLIRRTIGYNMQIKHQNGRNTAAGIPSSATTIIRHNVFSKGQNGATGSAARPSLLVGHWPLSGSGSSDTYQIYGNLFYENPTEALFQGEGNVVLHDNLFVKNQAPDGFAAVSIQPHNDVPKAIEVFHNTVVAAGPGIRIVGANGSFQQRARANAVFSQAPQIVAPATTDNVSDLYANAGNYLVDATSSIGAGLDLFPLAGALLSSAADLNGLTAFADWDRDFNDASRDGTFRGAYAGEGINPGWSLALSNKPEVAPSAADLAVEKTNNVLVVTPATTTTFEVRVSNNGPDAVSGATLVDTFDGTGHDVANVSFTCTVSTGASAATSCPAAGTGAELVAGVDVDIDAGDAVIFSVDTPIFSSAAGLLFNVVTVTPPAQVTDANPSNDRASDVDGVPGGCGFPADLYLSDQFVDSTTSFEACQTLSAGSGLDVLASGHLTLRSGDSVTLRDGFFVRKNARLTITLDASLSGSS